MILESTEDMKDKIEINGTTYYGVTLPTGSSIVSFFFIAKTLSDEAFEEDEEDPPVEIKFANKEMEKWIGDNINDDYILELKKIYFANKEEAVAFKLRWT